MFIDNNGLSFVRGFIGTYYMPRTLLGIKTQSPEAFPKKVTFKLLGNEDFQRLTQKLLYHTRRNTNGKMITKKKKAQKAESF